MERVFKRKGTVKDVFNAVLNELKTSDDQIKVNQLGVSLLEQNGKTSKLLLCYH